MQPGRPRSAASSPRGRDGSPPLRAGARAGCGASDLRARSLRIRFANPVLLASGTAGYGWELLGVADLSCLYGLVTKAVSLAPRRGNAAPRVAEFRGGMLNSIGLANPGADQVARDELPWLPRQVRAQVLVNVVGFTIEEYAEVIARLESVSGHAGYELNLSRPNTSAGGVECGADPDSVRAVVSRCRAATTRPALRNSSPALPDIPSIAAVAHDAGADGITLVNTMPGYLFDGDAPRLGNGFGGVSGPALCRPACWRSSAPPPDFRARADHRRGWRSDRPPRVWGYLRAGATLVSSADGGLPNLGARNGSSERLAQHGG
ncbi:MAG: dihydroorotate dehydrogenase [Gemmatimonadetes bacterium]|nr:dihydroorotate dehydrogenase [Gemmatimonadota bacterium]